MKIRGIPHRVFLSTIEDALVINNVAIVIVDTARRNRVIKSVFNEWGVLYNTSKLLTKLDPDHYYYIGGLSLLEAFNKLTNNEFTDIIGEDTINKLMYLEKVPEKIILQKFKSSVGEVGTVKVGGEATV